MAIMDALLGLWYCLVMLPAMFQIGRGTDDGSGDTEAATPPTVRYCGDSGTLEQSTNFATVFAPINPFKRSAKATRKEHVVRGRQRYRKGDTGERANLKPTCPRTACQAIPFRIAVPSRKSVTNYFFIYDHNIICYWLP